MSLSGVVSSLVSVLPIDDVAVMIQQDRVKLSALRIMGYTYARKGAPSVKLD